MTPFALICLSLLAAVSAQGTQVVDAVNNQVVYGSTSGDLSKCLQCNTAVSLPAAKCGIDANTMAAMEQKAALLEADINKLEASECCTVGQTPHTNLGCGSYGYELKSREKGGDGAADVTVVDVVHRLDKTDSTQVRYCLKDIEIAIDNARRDMSPEKHPNLEIKVLYNDTSKADGINKCTGLVERCTIKMQASVFDNAQGVAKFPVPDDTTCKAHANDYVGWRFVEYKPIYHKGFIQYSWVADDAANQETYCMKDHTKSDTFAGYEKGRGNRLYSVKFGFCDCTTSD